MDELKFEQYNLTMQLSKIINSKFRLLILLTNDFLIGILSYIAGSCIIFNIDASLLFLKQHMIWILAIPIFKNCFLYFKQIYSISWRYASLKDIAKTFQTISISSLLLLCLSYFFPIFSIRLFVADFLVFCGLFFCSRFMIRVIRRKSVLRPSIKQKQYLIIGAGDAAEMVARELLKTPHKHSITGFLDDNPLLHRKTIHQSKVFGNISMAPSICDNHSIDQIIIAVPSATVSEFRNILNICKLTNVPFLTTPRLDELLDNTVKLDKLRDVSIVDLLGRSQINIDNTKINAIVKNKTIFITGAGGSIGSELSRQILSFEPKKVVLIDHSEFHLYSIMMELSKLDLPSNIDVVPLCLDIKTLSSLKKIFNEHLPDVVFHSAAYKHVPLMEVNAEQAILNNIGGTKNIIDLCDEFNVDQCIVISTDKAVEPSNSMGSTKRLCELLTLNKSKTSSTKYCCVRFGNVLGSYGSVIPLFKEQIKAGGPITITDPKMTRYFMTIKEAVSLVFQAASISTSGGELFVLDMGSPIKIVQLATDLIRLSGLTGDEIKIVYTGLRPGEKLSEKLFYDFEKHTITSHEKIYCCYPNLSERIDELIQAILELAVNEDSNELLIEKLISTVDQLNHSPTLVSGGRQ